MVIHTLQTTFHAKFLNIFAVSSQSPSLLYLELTFVLRVSSPNSKQKPNSLGSENVSLRSRFENILSKLPHLFNLSPIVSSCCSSLFPLFAIFPTQRMQACRLSLSL
jgi:hypothetical protein